MQHTYTQEKKKDGGYMTLFASLLFLVMTTLLFVCLDGILVYEGKSAVSMTVAGAGEHLLANYDKDLASQYALYFLDSRLEPNLMARTTDYFKEHLNPYSGTGRTPIMDIGIEQLYVNAYGTMQEQDCRYFKEQAAQAVYYSEIKDLFANLLSDSIRNVNDQKRTVEDMKNTLDSQDTAVQEASDTTTGDVMVPSKTVDQEQAGSHAQVESPVVMLKNILKNGVLSFVMEGKKVSDRQISTQNLPSDSKKETMPIINAGMIQKISHYKDLLNGTDFSSLADNVKEKTTLALYGYQYLNYFGREEVLPDTKLLYEYEYILGGQGSDRENLEYIAKKLILLRFSMNMAYVLSDVKMCEQARILSASMTGISGSPVIVEGTKYVILGAVSLIESFHDVKSLFGGKKVPLIKDRTSFHTTVTGGYMNDAEEDRGLTYDNYLLLLFLLSGDTNRNCLRMQDIMQINIGMEREDFSILKSKIGVSIEASFKQKIPFLAGTYTHEIQESYQY